MERNRRHQEAAVTIEQYFANIEELLKLTGRKIKPRRLLAPNTFKL